MNELVLVADADPFNLRLLSELCATLGYDVMTAADGGAVLDAMARERPSLVLMDATLPGMDGFQVLHILKSDGGFRHVPVLLVTSENDLISRERGLALGADDYLTKPYRTFEIQQRVRNVLKLRSARGAERGSASGEPAPIIERVVRARDTLTDAGTANELHISLDYEFTRAVRFKHSLSCVAVSCLNYVELAQQLGPAAPQLVIAPLANVLSSAIRNVDHLFRADLHELCILLPGTGVEGSRIVVERLHGMLRDPALFGAEHRPLIGVASASFPDTGVGDGEGLWRAAREALNA